MNWGLKQGLLGAGQKTLTPSMVAVGQNTYLRETDFFKMLGVALLLHAVILGAAHLWPEEKVTDIPVRALTFKIGAGQRIMALPMDVAPVQPQPLHSGPWRAAPEVTKPQPPKAQPKPEPVKPAKIIPLVPAAQRQKPIENEPPPQRMVPSEQTTPQPATQPRLPDTSVLTSRVAIAPTPQRFIRETPPTGSLGTINAPSSSAAEAAQAIRAKYELEISSWIQRHYPQNITSGPRKLRPVVRMRIDRQGSVRYYAIEESSGSATVDAAAIDMIRRANPLPAVPDSYPAGNLIEFLIPIVFRVP